MFSYQSFQALCRGGWVNKYGSEMKIHSEHVFEQRRVSGSVCCVRRVKACLSTCEAKSKHRRCLYISCDQEVSLPDTQMGIQSGGGVCVRCMCVNRRLHGMCAQLNWELTQRTSQSRKRFPNKAPSQKKTPRRMSEQSTDIGSTTYEESHVCSHLAARLCMHLC